MSRLDLASLALTATQNIQTADEVRRDPAVIKAAQQFTEDSTNAIRSGSDLIRETRSAWRRHGTDGSAPNR